MSKKFGFKFGFLLLLGKLIRSTEFSEAEVSFTESSEDETIDEELENDLKELTLKSWFSRYLELPAEHKLQSKACSQ